MEGCNYSVCENIIISVLDLLVAVIPVTLFSTKEEFVLMLNVRLLKNVGVVWVSLSSALCPLVFVAFHHKPCHCLSPGDCWLD